MASDNGNVTYCNARTRDAPDDAEKCEPGPHAGDDYCNHPTDGGRCRMHGRDAGRPVETGLHSFRREELQQKYEQALKDEPWGDLRAEIAVLKTLLSDFLSDVEAVDSDTINDATALISELRRTSDTLQTMLHREAPTEEEIQRLITGFANLIETHVSEEHRADAIEDLRAIIGDRGRNSLPSGRERA